MTTAPLCLLTLLLAARSASTEGESELCPAWTSKAESRVRVFQRPQEREGADATFCWGTCSLPCCCASGEARLGQRRCPRALHLEANAAGGPEPPQSPIHNLLQNLLALLVFILLLFHPGFEYCWERYSSRKRERMDSNITNEHLGQTQLEDLGPPPPYALEPPPYGVKSPRGKDDVPPPLPDSPIVQFHHANTGNAKDVAVLCTLTHRSVLRHASGTFLEAESSADQ